MKGADAVAMEVDILYYTLDFFSFWRIIVISRKDILNTLYSILLQLLKLIPEPFLYHSKKD